MPELPSVAPGTRPPRPHRPGRAAKPWLAALLPLPLAFGLLLLAVVAGPVLGQTTNTDYDGDDDGLIEISNAAQLDAIRHDLNGDGDTSAAAYDTAFPNRDSTSTGRMGCPSGTCTGYELAQNITLTGNWTPIGTYTATLDGGGFAISGLNISVTSGHAGLFQRLGNGGVIRDLGIMSPTVASSNGNSNVGALAGRTDTGSLILSSYVSGGTVTLGTGIMRVGGLVGWARGGTIRASWSTATIDDTNPCTNCNSVEAGGLVGRLSGPLIASYAAGANQVSGGLTSFYGGLVGRAFGTTPDPVPTITNSYCDSTVMVVSFCVGGRQVGVSVSSTTSTAYTTTQLQTPTDYTGIYSAWNINLDGAGTAHDFPWNFGANNAYPTLNSPAQRATAVAASGDFDADDDGLIEIDNTAKLNAIRHDLNGDGQRGTVSVSNWGNYTNAFPNVAGATQCDAAATTSVTETCSGYELTANLTLTGNWTPTGTWAATFDGDGHTLTGATIAVTTNSDAGFFGNLGAAAVIRDLGLVNFTVTGTTTSAQSNGILTGYVAAGATIANVYASGGTVTGATTVGSNVGGLVGYLDGSGSTLTASYSTANVTVSGTAATIYAGGLAGRRRNGTITDSYATGTITDTSQNADANVGELVGRSEGTSGGIVNSYCVASTGNCIGTVVASSAAVSTAAHTAAELQAPTGYTDMYLNWNRDLDGDDALDYPWDFRTSSDYPILNTPTERASLVPAAMDYDADDDGLIDISTQAQLNAMRWDLNGDGDPETANANAYGTTFAGRQTAADATSGRMGCPLTTPTAGCVGYELTGDLALTGNWTPIGSSSTITYNTTFEGNGHTISGLTVSVSADAGLFGRVGGSGVVRNVGIISPSVTSSRVGAGAAGLAGNLATGGVIEASYVDGGTITLGNGLVTAGGLVGYADGAIRASWSTATLQRTSPCNNCNSVNVGGLAGRLVEGSITASYAAGANNAAGGSGAILGGLVGRVTGNNPTITHSYCDSTVMVVTNCVGGYAVPAAAAAASADTQSTSELQTPTDYTGIYSHWNLDLASPTDNVPDYLWNFGANNEYPTLNTPTQRAALLAAIDPVDYDYNDNGLIDITTAAQLNAVRWDANGDGDPATADAMAYSTVFAGRTHTADSMTGRMGCPVTGGCTGYELLTNLTLTGQWTPMDFSATFNGQGYTISGLNVSVSSGNAGLFGELSTANGVIRNVGVITPSVTNTAGGWGVGGLAGRVSTGAAVETSYVAGGTITVAQGTQRAGGLVGFHHGAIRASYATATLNNAQTCTTCNSIRTGGLVGALNGGSITASYAAAANNTSGLTSSIGGLVGLAEGTSPMITDSYCDSTVRVAADCVGGRDTGISVSDTTAAGHPTADLQSPTGYTAGSIYENWNLNLDGVTGGDDPWDFGTTSDYPIPRTPANRPSLAARNALLNPQPQPQPGGGGNGGGGSSPQPVARGGGSPYNPAHAHPEIYANPRHEMAVSCEVRTTGTGDAAKTTSTLTFDLGTYTRPITLVLSLWDGQFFRTLQSQNLPMPELRQDGQTATVEVVTNPSQTRFRIDSQYGLNLVLGYADCRTDDPE